MVRDGVVVVAIRFGCTRLVNDGSCSVAVSCDDGLQDVRVLFAVSRTLVRVRDGWCACKRARMDGGRRVLVGCMRRAVNGSVIVAVPHRAHCEGSGTEGW